MGSQFFFDKQLGTTKTINQQTFQVKESFKHGNGSTYYALYTDKNQFIGWINAKGAADAKSPGGIWQSESKIRHDHQWQLHIMAKF